MLKVFNSEDRIVKRHTKKQDEFTDTYNKMLKELDDLYVLRKKSLEFIGVIEIVTKMVFKNEVLFDRKFREIKGNSEVFRESVKIEKTSMDINTDSQLGGAVKGIAVGSTVAVAGPSVAMAIATTFGTASTGAAISGLSGAAATNAALAWLGGGAIATGGGGIAAGAGILALAAPLGLAIAGGALVVGVMKRDKVNKEITEQCEKQIEEFEKGIEQMKKIIKEVSALRKKTEVAYKKLEVSYLKFSDTVDFNYENWNKEQVDAMKRLLENTKNLAEILNDRI
ncbi:MAG: hypothetical protein ACRDCW_12840 [Sarcina sp.]